MTRVSSVVTAICALTMLVACETTSKTEKSTSQPAAMGAINDTCPMTGEPVSPSAKTVSYGEHEIGFCCDGCQAGWAKMSSQQKADFVAGALASPGALKMCPGCGEVKGSPECCK